MEGPIEGLMEREPPLDPATYNFEPPLQTPPPGPDCERCRIMVAICTEYGATFQWERFVLHRSRAELDHGVRARCWWCLRVAQRLTRFDTEPDGDGVPFLTTFEGEWFEGRWLSVSVQSLHAGLGFHVYGFRADLTDAVLQPLVSSLAAATAVEESKCDSGTGGPVAWEYISGRLKACVGDHVECCLGGDLWVPTRLLEVTAIGGDALHFRVVLTRNWKDKERYISVSHRWGGNKIPKLTSATFDAYQRCIPVEVLPQKFLDAGKVAVRLGIRYLWIDSLCIIQDSVEDWEEESAQMHQVYRQGFCNLSAASADMNDDGLFYERDAAWRLPHVVYPRNQDRPLLVMDERDERWFQALDREPLYARSWVCQERLLSTRNISFTKDLIFFECARDLGCETNALTQSLVSDLLAPEDAQRLQTELTNSSGFRFFSTDAGDAAKTALSMRMLARSPAPYRYWQDLVGMYSSCRITVPTDKLVALAGVARAFHETTGAVGYAAGLWAENLVEDLAWYTLPHIPTWSTEGPPPDYVAPSWSWAAAWAVVVFWAAGATPTYPLAEVRSLTTVPHGRNAFGRVRAWGNSLRLLCHVVPLAVEAPGWLAVQKAMGDLCQPGDSWMEFHGGFDREDGESVDDAQEQRYFLALLFYAHTDPPTDGDYPSDDVLPLLMLEPCTPAWGVYRRVGIVHVHVFHRASDEPPDGGLGAELPGTPEGEELPAVCQEARARGLRPELCRALGRVLQAAREADVPSLETEADGRRIVTIV